jgi:hypothetical protein
VVFERLSQVRRLAEKGVASKALLSWNGEFGEVP